MITVHITMTGKSYNPKDKYVCFGEVAAFCNPNRSKNSLGNALSKM